MAAFMTQSKIQNPQSKIEVWLLATRPKTLWAAFAPVLVGVAMAVADGVAHPLSAALALLGALLIQIGTNFYNDYADFEKGADTSERKGPLRVTQAGLVAPETMKQATVLVFALAVAAGGYLMWRGGWPIILIGVLSILFGVLYTAGKYSLAYLGIADLFVLIFFGPVAVAGTYFVQALQVSWPVIVAGFGPGLLAVAILLVNNIRDIDEDRQAGKRTLIVRFGRGFGLGLYGFCLGAALLLPVALYMKTGTHLWGMGVLLLMPLALITFIKVRKTHGVALNPLLGATARMLLLYSILISIGWNLRAEAVAPQMGFF